MLVACNSTELYDQGYAHVVYTIAHDKHVFRYRRHEVELRIGTVPLTSYGGWTPVAKWDDVLDAAAEQKQDVKTS